MMDGYSFGMGGMGVGMGLVYLLALAALILGNAALIKYLFFSRR